MVERSSSAASFMMLCLIGFFAFFSSHLRIPVMPLYATTLGAGPAQVGLINGAFMLTAGLLSIPAGMLTDRVGRKPPIVIGSFAIAVSSLLIPLCGRPMQMAVVYILFGTGLAFFAPAMLSLVADVVPADRFGQAYSWYTTAGYFAMTVGPATGGFLAETIGLREVFLVSGCLSVAITLLTLFALPKGNARHRSDLHSILAGSSELLRNRFLQACLVATLGSCIGYGVFQTFLPLSAVFHGLNLSQVGILFAAQAMTNVVCRIPIGMIAEKTDRRRIVAAGLLVLAVALVALGLSAQLSGMVICAVFVGIGMALVYTAIGVLIAEQVQPLQRGLAMGLYHSSVFLGMMAGSTVMGFALKWINFPAGYAVSGGVSLLSLVWFVVLFRDRSKNCRASAGHG